MTTTVRSLVASLALPALLAACGGGGGGEGSPAAVPTPTPVAFTCPAPPDSPATAPQVTLSISSGSTALGTLVITLAPDRAPLTVANYLAYVNSGFYDNTAFHRHARAADLSTFVLQGGGYTAPLVATAVNPPAKATRPAIALERGLSNTRCTVAMARTNVLNSATSEFFINTGNNTLLDESAGGYAAFGAITAGADVVGAMVAAPCVSSPSNLAAPDCLPVPNLVITRAVQSR